MESDESENELYNDSSSNNSSWSESEETGDRGYARRLFKKLKSNHSSDSEVYEYSEGDYVFPESEEDSAPTASNTSNTDSDNESLFVDFYSGQAHIQSDLKRIFRIPPRVYCKTSRTICHVSDSDSDSDSTSDSDSNIIQKDAVCNTCANPTDDYFSLCSSDCFKERGKEGENKMFFYLRQAFHRQESRTTE